MDCNLIFEAWTRNIWKIDRKFHFINTAKSKAVGFSVAEYVYNCAVSFMIGYVVMSMVVKRYWVLSMMMLVVILKYLKVSRCSQV